MADLSENLSRQADEVEALSSIYGDEWCVVDEASRVFCIDVQGGEEVTPLKIALRVILPDDYPSQGPPQYQISAPWLRGNDRRVLANSLEEIFCENMGENIVYMWVEKIREFVTEKALTQDEEPHGDEGVNSGDDGANAEGTESDLDTSTQSTSQIVMKVPLIYDGEPMSDRKSKFQAHLAAVSHKDEVKLVLDKLLENRKVAAATHNIFAFRIETQSGNFLQGCEDDGETHAGNRMLHLLQIIDARNVIVIVTRWYGGIHLGPDRFKHINNLTREILGEHGYISQKGDKKGPSSSKKGR